MTPAELYARHEELQKEEWHKGALDGGQNVRALVRLVNEQIEACAALCDAEAAQNVQSGADPLYPEDVCEDLAKRIRQLFIV